MMDSTFLIPTRIETEDRLRNIISSVSYLLRHVPAKVIVKEVSGRNTFLHSICLRLESMLILINLHTFTKKIMIPYSVKVKY